MTVPAQTEQQKEAVSLIEQWYDNPKADQVFRLFGFAGTGKTTLARQVVDTLGLESSALYAAYTGKAAYVLQSKGCSDARTIHSLIYLPKEKAKAKLKALKDQLEVAEGEAEKARLTKLIKDEERNLEVPDWILNLDSDLNEASILILDEVSMVDQRIAVDLMSFGVRMLVLGDPAQLPPVGGEGWFMKAKPDYLLTEIHRSALDSPVTRLSMTIRNAKDRMLGIFGMDGESGRREKVTRDELAEFDQVLVGTNRTRWNVINLMREMRGCPAGVPVAGDRIMVLANNRDRGVFNGQQLTIEDCRPSKKVKERYEIAAITDEGKPMKLRCWESGFKDFEGEGKAKKHAKGNDVAATFADAVTVHKAQGSQWGSVLVIDESSSFYGMKYAALKGTLGNGEAHQVALNEGAKPWVYTAVTRAAERVVLIPSSGVPS